MQIAEVDGAIRVVLTSQEAHLLRRALERASFIDTPVEEQGQIQEFCARVLEALAATKR